MNKRIKKKKFKKMILRFKNARRKNEKLMYCGMTSSFLNPMFKQSKGGFIVIDPKGVD